LLGKTASHHRGHLHSRRSIGRPGTSPGGWLNNSIVFSKKHPQTPNSSRDDEMSILNEEKLSVSVQILLLCSGSGAEGCLLAVEFQSERAVRTVPKRRKVLCKL